LTRTEVLAQAREERRKKNPPKKCSVVGCSAWAKMRRLCPKHYVRLMRHGSTDSLHTGRRLNDQGYVMLKDWAHPRTGANGYVREHDVVMEGYLRRYLKDDERVHHINGDRADNEVQNLVLFSPPGKHTSYHQYLRWNSPEKAEKILREMMTTQIEKAVGGSRRNVK